MTPIPLRLGEVSSPGPNGVVFRPEPGEVTPVLGFTVLLGARAGVAVPPLLIPPTAPELVPEGLDAAPAAVAVPFGAAVSGPLVLYPTPTNWFVFQSRVEGALAGGTSERKVCDPLGSY